MQQRFPLIKAAKAGRWEERRHKVRDRQHLCGGEGQAARVPSLINAALMGPFVHAVLGVGAGRRPYSACSRGLTFPTIRRPTHQGCLIHPKEFEKHAPVREPSTPRTIVPKEEGVPDGGLPRGDRTTWFVAGSRQRAARRTAVSAHMALDGGVDCRCRSDHRLCWGAADPSDPLGRRLSLRPLTISQAAMRRSKED
jgi:hypothetical protein